ncbi:hypothetical protein V8E36_008272 [Tilletia maclaganii]
MPTDLFSVVSSLFSRSRGNTHHDALCTLPSLAPHRIGLCSVDSFCALSTSRVEPIVLLVPFQVHSQTPQITRNAIRPSRRKSSSTPKASRQNFRPDPDAGSRVRASGRGAKGGRLSWSRVGRDDGWALEQNVGPLPRELLGRHARRYVRRVLPLRRLCGHLYATASTVSPPPPFTRHYSHTTNPVLRSARRPGPTRPKVTR